MTPLDNALGGVTAVGFDTSPIIYLIEANPKYDVLISEIFRRIDQGVLTGFTSVITLTEILTLPLKQKQTQLQEEYRNLLLDSANFHTLPIDAEVAGQAAGLRAQYGLRTPDAMQIALAKTATCQVFLTNNKALERVTDVNVLILNELTLQQEDRS